MTQALMKFCPKKQTGGKMEEQTKDISMSMSKEEFSDHVRRLVEATPDITEKEEKTGGSMEEQKETLSIQSLGIRIDNDSTVPHIVLNGVDFKSEDIGLMGLKILWGSREDEMSQTLIQVDYIDGKKSGSFREVSIKQSFPNTLLDK